MGLAASQARLLNLTSRMHDIEYKAQNLEAQKLQMANESTQVYQEYENALNKQKVQFKQIGTDGSASYVDADIATLLKNGYRIKIMYGSNWYDFVKENNTDATNGASKWLASDAEIEEVEVDVLLGPGGIQGLLKDMNIGEVYSKLDINESKKYILTEPAKAGDSTITGRKLLSSSDDTAKALGNLDFNDMEVLRNLVEAGFIVFEKPMSDGTYEEVNIATDTSLQEVSDETLLKKAEAKYEADMRKINQKDKKFDTDLAAMDAERNAIKTEMDTLKSVAKENVDRTFKLFG